MALLIVSRRYGYTAVDCSARAWLARSWFGSAGLRPGSTRSRAADLVYPHYFGPGHHLFLDIAVADPGVGAALFVGHAFIRHDFWCRRKAACDQEGG